MPIAQFNPIETGYGLIDALMQPDLATAGLSPSMAMLLPRKELWRLLGNAFREGQEPLRALASQVGEMATNKEVPILRGQLTRWFNEHPRIADWYSQFGDVTPSKDRSTDLLIDAIRRAKMQ